MQAEPCILFSARLAILQCAFHRFHIVLSASQWKMFIYQDKRNHTHIILYALLRIYGQTFAKCLFYVEAFVKKKLVFDFNKYYLI
jgi:hypothetical protein